MIEEKIDMVEAGYRRRKIRYIAVTVCLLLLVLFLCGTMLVLGNNNYSPEVVIRVFMGEKIKGASFAIGTLRLPRMLSGLMVGVAFGMAGSTFQTMLRNPLASPDIIGVTSGSSAAAIFSILVLKLSGNAVSIAAVFGGVTTAAIIYLLSKGGKFEGGRLILIGMGVEAMLKAVISYLLLNASQYDVPGAFRWLSGSLNGVQMSEVPMLGVVTLLLCPIIIVLGKNLKILELGEQSAITLGVNADRTRILLILSAVGLIAFGTAVTGPIAFVSFLAGPIASRLVGSGAQTELPAGLVGAILVLLADLLGQFAFGTRFPAGVITGILGAPYLLFLLIRINRSGGSS